MKASIRLLKAVERARHSFVRFVLGYAVVAAALVMLALLLHDLANLREFAEQKATGLGAVASSPTILIPHPRRERAAFASMTYLDVPTENARKVLKKGVIRITAGDAPGAALQIAGAAGEMGGYVAESKRTAEASRGETRLSLRVPADRFDELRSVVRAAAREVLEEHITTEDVTKNYFDLELTLRNYRAEEEQYLSLLKRAARVADIVQITGKLNEVRERIHRAEGELRFTAHEVAMSSLAVHVIPEQAAKVFGVRWRPLLRLKSAFYDGLESIGNFGSLMAVILFQIPAVALWLASLVALLALAWRLLNWVLRLLFPDVAKRHLPPAEPAS